MAEFPNPGQSDNQWIGRSVALCGGTLLPSAWDAEPVLRWRDGEQHRFYRAGCVTSCKGVAAAIVIWVFVFPRQVLWRSRCGRW